MTRPVRVLVADDERAARERLLGFLRAWPDFELVASCSGGVDALDAIRAIRPDIAFLDIQMPDLNGLEVVRRLAPAERPVIVFATAYDAYAVQAFEAHAIDYLLKPYSADRFADALRHAASMLHDREARTLAMRLRLLLAQWPHGATRASERLGNEEEARADARLLLRERGRMRLVAPDDIAWVEVRRDIAVVHTGTQQFRVRSTLAALRRQLEPHGFLSISRSVLVARRSIHQLVHDQAGRLQVILADGTALPVSRRQRQALLEGLESRD